MIRLLLLVLILAVPRLHAEWRILHLDDRTLALTCDDSGQLQEACRNWNPSAAGRPVPKWETDLRRDLDPARIILEKRPALVRSLRDNPQIPVTTSIAPVKVLRTGFWMNPTGLLRVGGLPTRNAEVAYHLFLQFDRPLSNGEKLKIHLPGGETLAYTHAPDIAVSALFKWNQAGYPLEAGRRYAYLGAWLGTVGPMPLKQYAGKPFELIQADTGKTVFRGTLAARCADPDASNGAPFTGEETLELDFSEFNQPGKYYLHVDGIGRSETFIIGRNAAAQAFFIHARGLYHKRCGIEKRPPFTEWSAAACHTSVIRGSFPPHERHYGGGDPKRDFGFYDAKGKSLSVRHFQLIAENAPHTTPLNIRGGWHDAADYDRRPLHLEIVGDLAAVYLLRPQNFSDGQLGIPESGNGIPDILDEASWGLRHLLAAQQPDGGVGTWFETTRHPRPGEGMPAQDPCVYYISAATRQSSLEYSAYAALLALALQKSGAENDARIFAESARRAWVFAMNPANRAQKVYSLNKRTVFYREPAEPEPEFLVKAGAALAQYFHSGEYLKPAIGNSKSALSSMRKNSWRRSPLFWIELELFPEITEELSGLRLAWRRDLLREADRMLDCQENSYPYRTPWFDSKSPWVHTMAWGTWHPLRRARLLVAAHAITGEVKYLDGAYLANDFHNGANPFGMSMTSGLGISYPVRFLDLPSYADGIAEAVPGITPYRNTFGIARADIQLAHGLYLKPRPVLNFPGAVLSLLPREGLTEQQCAEKLAKIWPVWRRWANVEQFSVDASEYTVWETIGPAAAVTGYLLNGAQPPEKSWFRKPAGDIRSLPGFAPLP